MMRAALWRVICNSRRRDLDKPGDRSALLCRPSCERLSTGRIGRKRPTAFWGLPVEGHRRFGGSRRPSTGKTPRPRSSSRGAQTDSAERKPDDGTGAAGLASPGQTPANRQTPFSLAAQFFHGGLLADGDAPSPQAAAKDNAEATEPAAARPGHPSGRLATLRAPLSRGDSTTGLEFLQAALAGPLTGAGQMETSAGRFRIGALCHGGSGRQWRRGCRDRLEFAAVASGVE